MKGYLLDTNAVSDWLDTTRPRHTAVSDSIGRLIRTETLLLTSTIVLGEIEYGIRTAPQEIQQRLEGLRSQIEVEFVHNRLLLDVTRGTTFVYGDLRARLFEKYAPGDSKKKVKRPEQLICPTTSKELGIQENDLWLAAQAIERNIVLVSNDAMRRIRAAAPELEVEDWGQP